MNALTLLSKQHDTLRSLLDRLDPGATDERHLRKVLYGHFADVLAAHTAIEERLFYPALKVGATEDLLRVAAEEHLSVKRIGADLLSLDPDGSTFDAKLAVLRRQLLDHVSQEELRIFPVARNLLGPGKLAALGTRMEALSASLLESEPRLRLAIETEEALPV